VFDFMAGNITRWNPFGFFGSDESLGGMPSLRQGMDRLFDDAFVRPTSWQSWMAGAQPLALDLYETDDHCVIKAAIPGVRAEDVEVTVQGNVLTIRGQTESEDEQKKNSYHLRERRYGSFFRQVQLPVSVDTEKAEAKFDNGILTLRFPKTEEARERRIQVTPGSTDVKAGAKNGSQKAKAEQRA
jgi:HSP20 family protein